MRLSLFRLPFVASLSWLLCAHAPRAADVTWVGTAADLNTGTNWSTGAAPLETDRAVFDGTGTVDLATFGASFQGAGNGIGGMRVMAGQTDPLSFNATVANVVFRLAANTGVTIDTGAGPVTWGDSGAFFFLNMGGASGTSPFVNNSSSLATIGVNATLGNGGATTQVAAFSGTGNWQVDGVIRVGGGGSVAITKAGTGVLTLAAANTYNGSTTIGGGTVVLSGGNNRLPTGTTVAFSGTSALELPGLSQTVSALTLPVANAASTTVISGANGSLLVNGAANLQFGPSGSQTATRLATVDMSGLGQFTYTAAGNIFRVGLASGAQNTPALGQVALVTLAGQNTITAATFALGDISANSDGGQSTLRLGQTNALNANTFNTGASGRSDVDLSFATGLVNPSAVIRGTSGGSTAVNSWVVGRLAQFAGAPQTTFAANVDFSPGSLDAKVTTLLIGSADAGTAANRAGTQNSTFAMGAGTLEVGALTLGQVAGASTSSVGGALSGNGTFTLNHPNGVVRAGTLALADNTILSTGAFAKNARGTFNLTDGTLVATSITRGAQTGTGVATVAFNWANGTVENTAGSNLTVTGVPLTLAAGTHTFRATGSNSITLDSASALNGVGGFSKTGTGILSLNADAHGYVGATVIEQGTLALSAANNNPIESSSRIEVQAGATLDLGGLVGGTLDLKEGQTVTGEGSISGSLIVDLNTVLSPGSSPGTLTTGDVTLGAGGTYRFELDRVDTASVLQDALMGMNDGHDFLNVQGGLNLVSSPVTPFLVEIDSLQANDTSGALANWNPNLNYTWRVATSTLNFNGFATDAISLDTSDFSSFNATPGAFSVSADGNNLYLHYVGVPEPESWVLLVAGLFLLRTRCRR